MEQTNITEMLQEFELVDTTDGLVVENPPIVRAEPREDFSEKERH